ncbi:MAG: hypothetical protein ABIJ16_07415 [Bacteroidota bacterium]
MRSLLKLLVLMVVFAVSCSKEQATITDNSYMTGSLARFTIYGDYLYSVTNTEIKIFHIGTEPAITFRKCIQAGFGIETIFQFDHYLFLGSQTGMYIYDISNPESPLRTGIYDHIYACNPLVADSNYAYITFSSDRWCGNSVNELQIADISDKTSPELVKRHSMTNPRGLGIDDTLLFVCDEGLKVLDVSDIMNIQELMHYNIPAEDVITHQNNLFVIGENGLYQYRYSEDSLLFISKISIFK